MNAFMEGNKILVTVTLGGGDWAFVGAVSAKFMDGETLNMESVRMEV